MTVEQLLENYDLFTVKDIEFLKDKWIKHKDDSAQVLKITYFKILDGEFLIGGIPSDILFKEYVFENGTPCGKRKESLKPSMNIFALEGHIVKFSFPENGYPSDSERAKRHLAFNNNYTVKQTYVSRSSTQVELIEFPFVYFNSVHFTDVISQSEEDDRKHNDYNKYN